MQRKALHTFTLASSPDVALVSAVSGCWTRQEGMEMHAASVSFDMPAQCHQYCQHSAASHHSSCAPRCMHIVTAVLCVGPTPIEAEQ